MTWILLITLWLSSIVDGQIPSCKSMIYCDGKLLDTVQKAGLWKDSKTFVDMKLKGSFLDTIKNFEKLTRKQRQPSKEEIKDFTENNFEMGDELQEWFPPDFKERPSFINRIVREDLKKFALDLIQLWPTLARKVKPDVADFPEKYSLIPVPNGCIVPGGRFREFYYWDSYWIVRALILCDMHETAKGMIENYFSMVQKYGFVPNGGRIYYLDRSQPPYLNLMAMDYINATSDFGWMKDNLHILDAELVFWLNKHMLTVDLKGASYDLFHFQSFSTTPRPESYIEDIRTCSYFESEIDKERCYNSLKSGAESGWDFSSRWIFDKGCGAGTDLRSIQTSRILPVDLNAVLYKAFRNQAWYNAKLGNWDRSYFWNKKAADLLVAINKLLWDEEDGMWYDFDFKFKRRRKFFFGSHFTPLWLRAFERHNAHRIETRFVAYLKKYKVMEYPYGLPTSLTQSGEQWDFPNAWAPVQDIAIKALWESDHPVAKAMGKELAEKWLEGNFNAYKERAAMFEKYSVFGQAGSGGEYEVQTGFGWTNAVCLEIINDFYTSNVTSEPWKT